MYPALITASFFTGVFLNDLIQGQPMMEITKHLFFGTLCVVILWVLDVGGKPLVSWGLLLVPSLVFGVGILYFLANPIAPQKPAPTPLPPPPPPPPSAEPEPETVNLPDALTACVEMDFTQQKDTSNVLPMCDVGSDGSIGMPGTLPPMSVPAPPPPIPACPSVLGGTSGSSSAIGPQAPGGSLTTSVSLLSTLNRSLTPVTTCH
jgi:hypothetical protein